MLDYMTNERVFVAAFISGKPIAIPASFVAPCDSNTLLLRTQSRVRLITSAKLVFKSRQDALNYATKNSTLDNE